MRLRELVDLYRSHAGRFGDPVALSAFGFDERRDGAPLLGYDEDYTSAVFPVLGSCGGEIPRSTESGDTCLSRRRNRNDPLKRHFPLLNKFR